MKLLYKHKDTLKDFVNYLQKKGYDAKKILTGNSIDSILYVIEYLSSHGIFCLVDGYSVIVYCDGKHQKAKDYVIKNKTPYIIKEINNKKGKTVIENYEYAIVKAFDFLEYDF